mgnify:CR=1 FL=1
MQIIENTATFDFNPDWLPNPQTERPALLHVGTLATAIEPGASVLFEWAQSVATVAPIVFDPNIRPSVIADRISVLSNTVFGAGSVIVKSNLPAAVYAGNPVKKINSI